MREVYFEPTGTYVDQRPMGTQNYVEEQFLGENTPESRLTEFVENRPDQNSVYEGEIHLAQEFFASNGYTLPSVAILSDAEYIPAMQGLYGLQDTLSLPAATLCMNKVIIRAPVPSGIEQHDKNLVLALLLHEGGHATPQNRENVIICKNTVTVQPDGKRQYNRLWGHYVVNGAAKYKATHNSTMPFIVGSFIEEGFVDLARVKAMESMQRHTPPKNGNNFITENLGVQFSPGTREKRRYFKRKSAKEEQQIIIPARYATAVYASKERSTIATSAPNLAAYGIDLLDQAQPGLFEQLTTSRKKPAEYARVIKMINELRPGLYQDLRELQYTPADFRTGIQHIKDAIR